MKPSQMEPAEIVDRIQKGDPDAEAELYRIFNTGVRFLMMRKFGNIPALEDELHSSFIITIEAIRNGVLREPERLMGFVRTVAIRRMAESISQEIFRRNRTVDAEEYVLRDDRATADDLLMRRQRGQIARQVLSEMSDNDREVLVRFYIEEQPAERICREMHLTTTQYRLLKHRAKARFAERGQRKLTIKPWDYPAEAVGSDPVSAMQ